MLIGITTYKLQEDDLLKLTDKCILSVILQQTSYPFYVVVSDQKSENSTLEHLSQSFSIKVIHEETDCLSRSWNLLCKEAFTNLGYCLILNNDVFLYKDTLEGLIEFAKTNTHSIITSPQVNDFSAFLISKEIYNEVGAFDENLKGGSLEDWDYTERLKEKGFSILPCPTFKVLHENASTTKLIEYDPEIIRLREESLQYYRKKWRDGRHTLP